MGSGEALERGRFRGLLLGLAVADSSEDGRWGANTSLALCLAESLLACRGLAVEDLMDRYLRWYRRGYWSSKGYCFGISDEVRARLEQFEANREVSTMPGVDRWIGPLVMFYARDRGAAMGAAGQLGASADEIARLLALLYDANGVGVRGIPEEARERCYRAAEIVGLADQLYELAIAP